MAIAGEQDFLLHDAIAEMEKPLRARAKAGARWAIALLEADHPEAASRLEVLA